MLKLIGEKMVVFRVHLRARWDATSGEVVQIEGRPVQQDIHSEGKDNEDGDEVMSD